MDSSGGGWRFGRVAMVDRGEFSRMTMIVFQALCIVYSMARAFLIAA